MALWERTDFKKVQIEIRNVMEALKQRDGNPGYYTSDGLCFPDICMNCQEDAHRHV